MKRKLLYSALVFFAFLFLAESAARLVEWSISRKAQAAELSPGWQTRFFALSFGWHEPDPDLLWRFRANISNRFIRTNSSHLIGDELPARKAPGSIRILLLGDSSPVGLGLKSYRFAFGELFRHQLEAELGPQTTVELINASVSGYSSEQLVRVLELSGRRYDPDLVILYSGNNDASISGATGDRDLLESQKLKAFRKTVAISALYRLLKSALLACMSYEEQSSSLVVRVTPDRFGANLSRIADLCRDLSCPLVVIKPPVPRLWPAGLQFKVFSDVTGRDGELILPPEMRRVLGRQVKYCISPDLFNGLYGEGDVFTRRVFSSAFRDSLPPEASVRRLSAQVQRQPENPILHNNLGVSLWQTEEYRQADYHLRLARELFVAANGHDLKPAVRTAGSVFLYNVGVNLLTEAGCYPVDTASVCPLAYQYLDSALQADYFSLRIKRPYQDQIDAIGNREDVYVVDLPGHFRRHGGETLFIDHCHPTRDGHLLIAEELFRLVRDSALLRP